MPPEFADDPRFSPGEAAEDPALQILGDMLGSQGDPRDLAGDQVGQLRALFEADDGSGLWLFAYFVCGLDKLTRDLHWEMCQFLSQWGQPGWRRLMMMVPRGSFKTSLGSKAVPLWLATRDPEATIGIFNAAQDQAKSWVGSIRTILESSHLYHMLWPERLPPGVHFRDRDKGKSVPRAWKWGDTGVLLVRNSLAVSELTFEPYGIGGSSTGRHYTHRIMDDLIGETSANSPALIEDAIHFVDHARALERPPNGGCELINCTPWAYRDCYAHVLTKWPDDYQVYRRSLLENPETGEPDVVNGVSIFPDSIDTAEAKAMYEADAFVFASQYQCIPQSGREVSFDREWIHPVTVEGQPGDELYLRIHPDHYDPKRTHGDVQGEEAPNVVALHWCDRALLLDPAPTRDAEKSREPRARNGLVVVAIDPWGRLYTLEGVPLREDPVTVMEEVVALCKRWRTRKVGIEEVNFSAVYRPLWTALLAHRHPGLDLSFAGLKPRGEHKDDRINSTRPPHREGLWFYNLDATGYVIQELLEFPNGETRDLIDAQAYWAQLLSRPPTPTEQEQVYYAQASRGQDPYTGYSLWQIGLLSSGLAMLHICGSGTASIPATTLPMSSVGASALGVASLSAAALGLAALLRTSIVRSWCGRWRNETVGGAGSAGGSSTWIRAIQTSKQCLTTLFRRWRAGSTS
jgi:hypothetical protein